MEIRRISIFFISLFFFITSVFSQLIDTSILKPELFPAYNKNTEEEAVKASQSKLYGTWYLQSGNGYFQIDENNKGSFNTLTDQFKGIKIVWSQNFLWKKEGGYFRVKFIGEAKYTLAESDQSKYEKLNRTEKDQLLGYFQSLKPKNIDSKPIEAQILFLNNNNLILKDGDNNLWLIRRNYINHLKAEAQKAEEEKERICAEAKAKAKAEKEARKKAEEEKRVKKWEEYEERIKAEMKAKKQAKLEESKKINAEFEGWRKKDEEKRARSQEYFETYAQKINIPYSIENNMAIIPLKKKNQNIIIDFKNHLITTPNESLEYEYMENPNYSYVIEFYIYKDFKDNEGHKYFKISITKDMTYSEVTTGEHTRSTINRYEHKKKK